MCFGGGGDSKIAKQSRADEVARQERIRSGMASIDQAFSGFGDAFFSKRAKDYEAYAVPQLERQARQQRESLIYALARTGNLDSSAAINKSAELTEDENAARIDVANTGLNMANDLRRQVEGTRGNVVAELNATGDSQAASAAALRGVRDLTQPAGFSPLGNLFASFAQTLGAVGSNAGNGYGGFSGAGRRLFAPGGGSQRVVGA
jgi:hypothetical protein